jgi:hypothetical protein
MVMWEIALTKRALKDAKKITRAGLKPKVDRVRPLVDKSCCNQGSTGNPY